MARYAQTQKNSCGPASLMCAAFELNVRKFGEHHLLYQDAELALYDIMANAPGGYSYPSGIVRGVEALGLRASVYIKPSKGLTFLTGRFSPVKPGLIDTE